jgi:hypothetical protein
MKHTFETFTGFCPKCDKKIALDASFCHHCGECLVLREHSENKKNPSNPAEIERLFESTTYLFIGWLFALSLVLASGIFYHFYHQSSFLIIAGVLFFYTWIFLISKLDELASQINSRFSKFVYLGLLIPVIGTIFSYLKISKVIKPEMA